MRSATIRTQLELELADRYPSPFSTPQMPSPETVPTGIEEVDRLTGGLPRGRITEVFGPDSSGRTSLLLSTLTQTTDNEEVCGLIDPAATFDPASATDFGVDLERLLWVRTGRDLDKTLKATDLLLQGGGFGLIGIDLGAIPVAKIRRIPLSTWFRLQRAAENTPTILLFLGQESCIKTCAALALRMGLHHTDWSPNLLCGIHSMAEIVRSRTDPAAGWSGANRHYRLESISCRRTVRNSPAQVILPPPQGIGIQGVSHHEH